MITMRGRVAFALALGLLFAAGAYAAQPRPEWVVQNLYSHNHQFAAQVIAYLHDVVEDTDATIADLEIEFGRLVAACVAILTDEPGATRQERKRKTYRKMADVGGELQLALLVKAADRLANMQSCIQNNCHTLLDIYRAEFPLFHACAYRPNLCDEIWREIRVLAQCGEESALA